MRKCKTIKQISNEYQIPKSTLYSFKRSFLKIIDKHNSITSNEDNKLKNQLKYRGYIYELINPSSTPLTISKIWNSFHKRFKLNLNKRELKNIIKNDFKFSYKRGSSAVAKIKNLEADQMSTIFAHNILSHILNKKLIINIDEVSFNRNLTNSYSWLPKSATHPIINIQGKGRWSMITAFLSNGQYLAVWYNTTISADEFSDFLSILKYALIYNK